MPRLSIIVPHRHHDARLEATLLSVLENRPDDSEIIVVHDGSYNDPYSLDDEVIFIAEQPASSTLQLLNAGLMASCSPAICVLLDGNTVSAGWSESPLDRLLGEETAAVAVSVASSHNSASRTASAHGIDARLLRPGMAQTGRVELTSGRGDCIGPLLACGFYRRKVLLALGGWNDALDEHIADVELALALSSHGFNCLRDDTLAAIADSSQSRRLSSTAWKQLASLAAAHGLVTSSWGNSISDLMSGCLQGRMFAALAWSAGLRDASTIRRTQLRLNHARQQFSGAGDQQLLRVYHDQSDAISQQRRFAA